MSQHYHRLFQRYPQLSCCRESIMEAYQLLRACYQHGGKVLLLGNGGSCADCEHIVGELMKGFLLKRPLPDDLRASIRNAAVYHPGIEDCLQQGLPALSLNGHTALTTAAQNDLSALAGPAQQLMALGRPGDVVLGISTSGNAENVAQQRMSSQASLSPAMSAWRSPIPSARMRRWARRLRWAAVRRSV